MSNIKNHTSQVECDYCHQLSFVDDLIAVDIADGPDDFATVGMCSQCAEKYYNHCIEEEIVYEEDGTRIKHYNEDDYRLKDKWIDDTKERK